MRDGSGDNGRGSPSVLAFPGHGESQDASASACPEGTEGAQAARNSGSTDVQVVGTRRDRNAWKAVREVGAEVLHYALGLRRGSVAAWARRLGIDASRISDWTGRELSKSPTIADVLLMEREDAIRFLRALVERLTGDGVAPDIRSDSHRAVTTAARLLEQVDAAMRDGRLDTHERASLAAIGDELAIIAENLRRLRAGTPKAAS